MKNKIFVISLIVLFSTLLVVIDTYALYELSNTGVGELDVGKWIIKVNDENVSLLQTLTLDDFVYSQSSHTQSGYFAPGMSATYDIEIDASEAEVSVEYELTVDTTELANYPNIQLTVQNLSSQQVSSGDTYTGVIGLSDVNRVITLQISLVWLNNPSYDESDTTLNGGELEIGIAADFKQYLGE